MVFWNETVAIDTEVELPRMSHPDESIKAAVDGLRNEGRLRRHRRRI